MKKLILALTFFTIIFSCSQDTVAETDGTLSFEEIAILFEMKQPFSETSKRGILNKYGTADAYYEYALKRRKELNISKNNLSSKIFNAKADYTVELENIFTEEQHTIICPDDEYILDVAEENTIDLPFSDRTGASPTCAALLSYGQIDQSDQIYLTQEMIDEGAVLLCVVYARSNTKLYTHAEDFIY